MIGYSNDKSYSRFQGYPKNRAEYADCSRVDSILG